MRSSGSKIRRRPQRQKNCVATLIAWRHGGALYTGPRRRPCNTCLTFHNTVASARLHNGTGGAEQA
eukprot:scaffold3329_cov120-Isochrysis_galbana.AAC.8